MREDIMAESIALVDRVELRIPASASEVVVAGFRQNGALSLFFNEDEVYQFNADGAWRRGYWQGRLLKAEQGRLVELTRERTAVESVLRRRDLDDEDQQKHLCRLVDRLAGLRRALKQGDVRVERSVSASQCDVVQRLQRWLELIGEAVCVAASPRVN